MFSNLIGPSPYTGKVTLAAGNDRAAEEPVTAAPTGAGREALAGKLSTHTGTGITGFRAQFPESYTIFTWGAQQNSSAPIPGFVLVVGNTENSFHVMNRGETRRCSHDG